MDAVRVLCGEVLPALDVHWITGDDHGHAQNALLAADRRWLSLVDCSSFHVMRVSFVPPLRSTRTFVSRDSTSCRRTSVKKGRATSFGLILYEMASGKKAFDEAESVQTLSAIIGKDPPPLDARLPAPLRWVIDRCLAKSPESRYDSTRDLFHELRAHPWGLALRAMNVSRRGNHGA